MHGRIGKESIAEQKFEILETKHHTLLSLDTCLNLLLLLECACLVEEGTKERIVDDYKDSLAGLAA